ncbi:MAG: methyltransferase domain-containing protein, partial [Clostridiales bacterium]|nr:methyltransferase domain-containing protein [Clostridiales bacterium]
YEIMKVAGGISESGIVVGNTYDKYNSTNPFVIKIMEGFEHSLDDLILKIKPLSIHEVGCGEGFLVLKWNQEKIIARGTDFSSQVIKIARENIEKFGLSKNIFQVKSIYDLDTEADKADLIVCCEVLEHLEHPEEGLRALQSVVDRWLILSVPREPLWSVLNIARGKYLKEFGNTPGHIQKWSKNSFLHLVSNYFQVLEVKTPLPWVMLLCQPLI